MALSLFGCGVVTGVIATLAYRKFSVWRHDREDDRALRRLLAMDPKGQSLRRVKGPYGSYHWTTIPDDPPRRSS